MSSISGKRLARTLNNTGGSFREFTEATTSTAKRDGEKGLPFPFTATMHSKRVCYGIFSGLPASMNRKCGNAGWFFTI